MSATAHNRAVSRAPLVEEHVSGEPAFEPRAQPFPAAYHPQRLLAIGKAPDDREPGAGIEDFPGYVAGATMSDLAQVIVGRGDFFEEDLASNHEGRIIYILKGVDQTGPWTN
jgi:hypothetical protein